MQILELVKDTTAEFVCYRDGDLWYKIGHPEDRCPEQEGEDCPGFFQFPVPVSDTGSGIFMASMKGISLMRWIRKHLEAMKEYAKEQEGTAQ